MSSMVDQGTVEKTYEFTSSAVATSPKINVNFTITSSRGISAPSSKSAVSMNSQMPQAFPQNNQMQDALREKDAEIAKLRKMLKE